MRGSLSVPSAELMSSHLGINVKSPSAASNGRVSVSASGGDDDYGDYANPFNPDEIAEHDDMFKDKIENQDKLPPRTLFGCTCRKSPEGSRSCILNDEVRFALWFLLLIMALLVIAFFIVAVQTHNVTWDTIDTHSYGIAVIVAGIFAGLASIVSFYQIYKHKSNYSHPPSQHLVIRILLMVPMYSLSAFLSLCFLNYSTYFDFLRTCYESFVIYSFMILLTKYLGGQDGVLGWLTYKPPIPWLWPLNCCWSPMPADDRFLKLVKYGALQYTLITPVTSVAAVIMTYFGVYGDGVVSLRGGYIYVAFVQNLTQIISLYCLAWLYFVMRNELAPFKPVAKFLVVKSVVFFTFWQSVGLAILVWVGVIQRTENFEVGQIQIGLQDFIVCIEMFIAAGVHKYTFGYETYANGSMKLIMEQRAVYLAQASYKKALENQKRRAKRKENAEMKAVSASGGAASSAVASVASFSSAMQSQSAASSAAERAAEDKFVQSRKEFILRHADSEGEIALTDDAGPSRLRLNKFHALFMDPENDLHGDSAPGSANSSGEFGHAPAPLVPRRNLASDEYHEI